MSWWERYRREERELIAWLVERYGISEASAWALHRAGLLEHFVTACAHLRVPA